MAHYTVTIKTLLENNFNFGLDTYPIYNETYRDTLNQKILNHYYENEIGFETAELFKFYLNMRMNEIMPYYNELYKAQEKALENLFDNVNLKEKANRKNQSTTNTNSNSNGKNQSLFQDTPQGKINMSVLENEQYATNFTINQNDLNDSTNSTGNNNEDYTREISGNNGNKYRIDLLKDIKNNLNNIDLLIINDLNELFMQIF